MNSLRTFLLLGVLTMLMVWVGSLIGGQQGMIIAFVLAVGMNFFSYWFSDKIVLKAYKAQPVSEAEAPELVAMVRSLATEAGLPMPKVCIVPSDTPNAFATGRNPEHAVVAVTRGIVNLLEPRELRGVLAHELGHVKNRDILIGSIAATISGAVMILASMARFGALFGGGGNNNSGRGGNTMILLLLSFLAPMAATIIHMAVSRSREYMADVSGAETSHDPQALASALAKLEQYNQNRPMANATPQTAHIFTVSPLSGGGMAKLFSTHPPIGDRIARLRQMGGPSIGSGRDSGYQEIKMPPPVPPAIPGRAVNGAGGAAKPDDNGKIDWS